MLNDVDGAGTLPNVTAWVTAVTKGVINRTTEEGGSTIDEFTVIPQLRDFQIT